MLSKRKRRLCTLCSRVRPSCTRAEERSEDGRFDAGKLGGFEWDLQSGRNPCFGLGKYALLGMTPAEFVVDLHKNFWDRVHPEGPRRSWGKGRPRVAKTHHAALGTGIPCSVARRGSTPGCDLWARFFYTSRTARHQAHASVFSTDITDRKIAGAGTAAERRQNSRKHSRLGPRLGSLALGRKD